MMVLQNNFLECFALKSKFHFYLSKKVFYLKNEVLLKNKLSLSSVKKKDRGKRLIKNWRPVSLLNTDINLTSKSLAKRIKRLLSSGILPNQTAYSENIYE